jgi:prephenate dehydrogenase
MLDERFSQISIIGTGLIGGSIGLALRSAGYTGRLVGMARRQSTIDAAVKYHCIDLGYTELAPAIEQADLVILAAPVSAIVGMMGDLATGDNGRMVITDAGSTKASIVAAAESALPDPARFVGSHPMAGTEQSGPEAADAELYYGKAVIVTPTKTTAAATTEAVEALWSALGMRIIRLNPTQADLAAARISHLPHAVAALLVELAHRTEALDVASTGFADVTRVASGGPELWTQIFMENAPAVAEVLGEFGRRIDQFRQLLEAGRSGELLQLLESVQAARGQWIESFRKAIAESP